MAKKELVEQIVKLYSKLGGNMSDVLGSRSNVTFLGTGKNPEPFIDMNINIEAVGALGKSKILEELKSPMGYLTADKLNDVQATKLYNNMLKLEEFYYPKQTANITDLASGTRNLTQEGLGSLRATADDTVFGLKDYDTTGMSDVKQRIIQLEEQLGRLNADAPGFRERAKPLVDEIEALQLQLKNVDLPPPGSRGGADDIAAPIQSAEETIRQLRIQDPDLANQVRRMVDEGIISTVGNKGGNPAKRASAREFLVEALKADDTFATKLGTIVDAQDVKFITEGGGGVAGDPIYLVEKYFGPRILEALPAGATGEDIITFTRRVMDNVEDAKGLKPDDPRFDRFTAQFVDEMAKGGRAGFRLGKNVFKGIAELFKKGGDDVDLIKQEKTFREGPITMKFLDEVDRGMANKFIRTRDMKGPQGYGLYESMADMPKGLQAAEFIKNIRGPRGNVDYEKAEMYIGGGVKLTGKETVDELIEMFLNAVKQPLAKGGRAGFMAGGIGKFTKAQVLIERLKNTIKDSKGKTDELSVYVNETFPGFIKEIKANPKLAENEQVWKTLGLDLPKDQKLVVYSDDTVDFFRQTEGPQNIAKVEAFMAKHPFLSREDALRIMKMEPEDQVLEITRLKVLNRRTKNAQGGLAKILEV